VNIYHITSREAWIDATRRGIYAAPSLETEGFIHCSTAAQVLPVARSYFAGQTGLVLLVIDTEHLDSELKWEISAPPSGIADDATFPHVYGPISLESVLRTVELETNKNGEFIMPKLAATNDAPPRSLR